MNHKKPAEQIHIENISLKRYELIRTKEDSYDEEKEDYTIEESEEVGKLGDQIWDCLKNWRYSLSFEFIFEEITKLGGAPCLLYDDNGHFAISGEGMQSLSFEPADTEMIHFIKKDLWKDSIREALNYYLDHDEEDEEDSEE